MIRIRPAALALMLAAVIFAGCNLNTPPPAGWCFRYDFTTSAHSATFQYGSWINGQGMTGDHASPSRLVFTLSESFAVQPVSEVVGLVRAAGDDENNINLSAAWNIFNWQANATQTLVAGLDSVDVGLPPPDDPATIGTGISIASSASEPLAIAFIEIQGNDVNPYGVDNCSPPTPSETPSTTPVFITDTPTTFATATPAPSATYTPSVTPTHSATPGCTASEYTWIADPASSEVLSPQYKPLTGAGQTDSTYLSDQMDSGARFDGYTVYTSAAWENTPFTTIYGYSFQIEGLVHISNLVAYQMNMLDPSNGDGVGGSWYPGGNNIVTGINSGWTTVSYTFSSPLVLDSRFTEFVIGAGVQSSASDVDTDSYTNIRQIRLDVSGGCPPTGTPTPTSSGPTATLTPTITLTPSPSPTVTPFGHTPGTGTNTPIVIATPSATLSPAPTFTLPPSGTLPPPLPTRTSIPAPTPIITATPNLTATPSGGGGGGGGSLLGSGGSCGDTDVLTCILNTIGSFFNWIVNTVLNISDFISSVFAWIGGTLANLATTINNLFATIGALINYILSLINQIFAIIGLIVAILIKLIALFVQWLDQWVNVARFLLQSYLGAFPTPIPYLPQCHSDPSASNVCAVYYLLQYTILGGTLGNLILPLLAILIDINTIFYFLYAVRNLLKQIRDVTA